MLNVKIMIVGSKYLFLSLLLLMTNISDAQNWSQVGQEILGGGTNNWMSAIDISSDGSKFAISEGYDLIGRVRVFERSGASWVQMGQDVLDGFNGNGFGAHVRMSADGNTIIAGGPTSNNAGTQAGQVMVYEWDGNSWLQKGITLFGNTDARFGQAVDIDDDGNRIVVGAPYLSNTNGIADTGTVVVYEWNGNGWDQMGLPLKGSAVATGYAAELDISGDGNTIAVSEPSYNSTVGRVVIYTWNGAQWILKGTFLSGTSQDEYYGSEMNLSQDGNTIAIGSPMMPTAAVANGQVEVYEWDGVNWNIKGQAITGTSGEWLGHSVALNDNGNILAVGAPFCDNGGLDAGANRIYQWDGANWNLIGTEILGTDIHNYSGAFDIALSSDGGYVAVLAYGNDDNGNDAGMARVFESPYLSFEDLTVNDQNLVYPNPFKESIKISFEFDIFEVYGLDGHLIKSGLSYNDNEIDLTDLEEGEYLLRLINDRKVYSCKIIH